MNQNKILLYVTIGLLAATLCVPLIVTNSLFFPFITGKAIVFRVLVELAFGVWLVLAFRDPSVRPKKSWIMIAVSALTLVALVADLHGVNPIRSLWSNFERMEGWITIIHLWAYFLMLSSVLKTRKAWHWFFYASLFFAFIVSMWALGQAVGVFTIHQSSDRLDASLGNAEYMAVYMLFHSFLALYLGVAALVRKDENAVFLAPVFGFLTLLFGALIFATQTRGTMIAIIFSFLCMLGAYAIWGTKERKMSRIVSGGVATFLILCTLGFYSVRTTDFVLHHAFLARLASVFSFTSENSRPKFIWPIAIAGFKEKPILGWGQENFNYVFNNHYNPNMWNQEQWFDRAHSVYFDWLIAGGILGLLAYLALFVAAIWAVWKSDFLIEEKIVLFGLLGAYGIHNLAVFDNLASYMMFFMILAFLHHEQTVKDKSTIFKANGVMNVELVDWAIAPTILVVLIGVFYFIDVRPLRANLGLLNALTECSQSGKPDATLFTDALKINTYVANQEIREQLYSCTQSAMQMSSVPNSDKQLFFQAALDEAAAQQKDTPNDLRGFLFTGNLFNTLGQWVLARPYLDRAYELSPNKQSVIFQVAINDINTNRLDDGVVLLKKAYELAPEYPDAQLAYARGLSFAKKYPEAIELFTKLLITNPNDIQNRVNLAVAYIGIHDSANAIAQMDKIAEINPAYKPETDKYIVQIKAGVNPFAQAVSGSSASTTTVDKK